MRTNLILLILLSTLLSCNNQTNQKASNQDTNKTSSVEKDLSSKTKEESPDSENKSLNDIRFYGWSEQQWYDNDYYRELRNYINTEIESSEIEQEIKDIFKSKFFIGRAEPYLLGGLLVEFVFIDAPNIIFSGHIYSDVDEETHVVSDIEVRNFEIISTENEFTKEEILQRVKSDPRNILW